MKIGIVYPFSSISAPEVYVYDALTNVVYEMAHRLAHDHDVTIYPCRMEDEQTDEDIEGFHVHRINTNLDKRLAKWKLTRNLGFRHFTAKGKAIGSNRYYYSHFAREVGRDAARRDLDVIHVHSVETLLPVIRRRVPDAKIVLHCHDHSHSDHASPTMSKMLAQADCIVTCSDFVSRNLVSHYPELEDRIFTYYAGVDQRYLDVLSAPAESEVVSFVGRMTPEKGVDVLLDAFDTVAPDHLDARLELVGPLHIGTRPFVDPWGVDPVLSNVIPYMTQRQEYLDQLQARVEQTLQVKYCGAIPNAELEQHYARLGVFAFPSLWLEPFGIPPLEAMAAGIPVVATRSGGLPETVQHEVTGFLVERGDASGLAAALRQLLDNPELRRQMGEAGRRRAQLVFAWERQIERLTALYEDLLRRESVRRG